VWCLAGQVSPLRPDDVLRAAQSMKTGSREDRDARILRHAQEDSPQLQEVARTKLLSMTEKSGDYNLNGTDSDLFKYGMVCCREYLDAWFKLQVCLDDSVSADQTLGTIIYVKSVESEVCHDVALTFVKIDCYVEWGYDDNKCDEILHLTESKHLALPLTSNQVMCAAGCCRRYCFLGQGPRQQRRSGSGVALGAWLHGWLRSPAVFAVHRGEGSERHRGQRWGGQRAQAHAPRAAS